MVPIFLIGFIIVGLVSSIRSLLTTNQTRNQFVSIENVILLCLIYVTVLIGFGLIYTILDIHSSGILVESGIAITGSFRKKLEASMYFSAITLLSVGYGDITPIGVGRWIAVIEALLGYIMPMAFVVRTVINIEKG